MTTLEIYAKRDELAKRILSIDSEEVLNKLSETLNELTNKTPQLPGIPTKEEVKERARRVAAAFRDGKMDEFVSMEELKRRHIS